MMAITAPVALNRPQATQWLPDQTGSSGLLAVNAGQSIRGMGLFPEGPNLYAYARQAPGKNTDYSGLAGDGTPKNNQAQNKQVDDVCRILKLTRKQREILHREISGENCSYQEKLQTAKDLFCN